MNRAKQKGWSKREAIGTREAKKQEKQEKQKGRGLLFRAGKQRGKQKDGGFASSFSSKPRKQ